MSIFLKLNNKTYFAKLISILKKYTSVQLNEYFLDSIFVSTNSSYYFISQIMVLHFKKSSIFWYYVEPTLAAPSLFCVDKLPLKRRLFLTGALNVSQMALSYVAKVSQNEKLFFIIQNVVIIFINQIKSFI